MPIKDEIHGQMIAPVIKQVAAILNEKLDDADEMLAVLLHLVSRICIKSTHPAKYFAECHEILDCYRDNI